MGVFRHWRRPIRQRRLLPQGELPPVVKVVTDAIQASEVRGAGQSRVRRWSDTLAWQETASRPGVIVRRIALALQVSAVEISVRGLVRRALIATLQTAEGMASTPFRVFAPVATTSAGNWTASTGTDLDDMVDEELEPNDADYIRSGASPTNDRVQLDLPAISEPEEGPVSVIIRVRKL